MRHNVIILTEGLAGSSVLAGLFGQAGYWAGNSTFKKSDYDTNENQELIDLNRRLFNEVGYHGKYEMVYPETIAEQIRELIPKLDTSPYREFINRCNQHKPWVWKDPRLTLTIRLWSHLLDLSQIRFIVLSRDPEQAWISATLRRQIQTRDYSRRYSQQVRKSISESLKELNQPFLDLIYEDLLLNPEKTLQRLSDFLEIKFTIDQLKQVYRGPLYHKQRGWRDLVLAYLIYFKNYSERYR